MLQRRLMSLTLFLFIILMFYGAVTPIQAANLEYQTKTLPNGMKLVYKNIPGAGTVTARMIIPTGFLNEPPALRGISHLLEHLIYRGSERYSAAHFQEQITDRGGEYNGYTSLDNTEYYLESLPENLLIGLEIYLDLILRPSLTERDIALEKKIVTVEKMLRTTPGDTFFLYVNSLTQEQLTENVRVISREDLVNYHARHYRTRNMTVIITGAFDLKKIQDLLTGQKDNGSAPADEPIVWRFIDAKTSLVLDDYLLGEEYQLLFGFNLPKPTPKDVLVAKVLPYILKYDSPQYDYQHNRPLDYRISLASFAGRYFLVLSYRDRREKYSTEMESWHQKNFARYCKHLKAKKFNKFLAQLTKSYEKSIHGLENDPSGLNELIARKLFLPAAITDTDLDGIRRLTENDFKIFVQKYLEVDSFCKIVVKAL